MHPVRSSKMIPMDANESRDDMMYLGGIAQSYSKIKRLAKLPASFCFDVG
jgi:hypothetical protein